MATESPDGIFMVADALKLLNRRRVYEFAQAHRLPAIYQAEQFVADGGLMSYEPEGDHLARCYLIARIFKAPIRRTSRLSSQRDFASSSISKPRRQSV